MVHRKARGGIWLVCLSVPLQRKWIPSRRTDHLGTHGRLSLYRRTCVISKTEYANASNAWCFPFLQISSDGTEGSV